MTDERRKPNIDGLPVGGNAVMVDEPSNEITGDSVIRVTKELPEPNGPLPVADPNVKNHNQDHSILQHGPSSTDPGKNFTEVLQDYEHEKEQKPIDFSTPSQNPAIVERSPEGRYLRFAEILGNGAYKQVFRAYDTKEGIEVAWNEVNLGGTPKYERNRIVNEVRLLERLHHANIISFYGSWVNRELEKVIFVTEVLSSGTLKSFINKVQVILWKIAKRWAIQILQGLKYLHEQDPPIIHRDLKCDNIFINGTSGDLRIGDFGLSTNMANPGKKALSVLGTPEFMAPELYDESYNESIDVYAFGMCLLEILTKEVPYSECTNPAQIYKKVTSGIPPASLKRLLSENAKDFILLCLKRENRPSASELLSHPFLRDKGTDDDKEVELEPLLHDVVITEKDKGIKDDYSPATSAGTKPTKNSSETSTGSLSAGGSVLDTAIISASIKNNNDDDNASVDHFKSMPDTEVNIKNVSVLMGRDLRIDEKNARSTPHQIKERSDSSVSHQNVDIATPASYKETVSGEDRVPIVNTNNVSNSNVQVKAEDNRTGKYIVEARTETPVNHASNFDDDQVKFSITLPVDGETQRVQFNFHLVEDDPVQVAREMITELHIPETAVLEISEIISGLARDARVKQEKYRKQRTTLQQSELVQPQLQPQEFQQPFTSEMLTSQQSQNLNITKQQQPVQRNKQQRNPQSSLGNRKNHSMSAELTKPNKQNPVNKKPQSQTDAANVNPHSQGQRLKLNPRNGAQNQMTHQSTQQQQTPQGNPIIQKPLHQQMVGRTSQRRFDGTQQQPPIDILSDGITQGSSQYSSSFNQQGTKALLSSIVSSSFDDCSGDSSDTDCEDHNMLKKRLQDEYEKNVVHASKAYDTRMDNLMRSMEVKEAEHKKTIEKHEKDLLEFEKRKKKAEIEQTRRLEELKQRLEEDSNRLRFKRKSRKIRQDNLARSEQQQQQKQQPSAVDSQISHSNAVSTNDLIDFTESEKVTSIPPRNPFEPKTHTT